MKYNNNELAKIVAEAATKVKEMRENGTDKSAQLEFLGQILDSVQEKFGVDDRHAAAYMCIDMING